MDHLGREVCKELEVPQQLEAHRLQEDLLALEALWEQEAHQVLVEREARPVQKALPLLAVRREPEERKAMLDRQVQADHLELVVRQAVGDRLGRAVHLEPAALTPKARRELGAHRARMQLADLLEQADHQELLLLEDHQELDLQEQEVHLD